MRLRSALKGERACSICPKLRLDVLGAGTIATVSHGPFPTNTSSLADRVEVTAVAYPRLDVGPRS